MQGGGWVCSSWRSTHGRRLEKGVRSGVQGLCERAMRACTLGDVQREKSGCR